MKNEERKNKTKENIINAYWYLFKKKGKNNVFVTDIAKKAKCNRATFYRYFIDANEILEIIESDVIEKTSNIFYDEINKCNFINILPHFITFDKELYEYYSYLLGTDGDPNFNLKLKKLIDDLASNTPIFNEIKEIDKEILLAALLGIIINIYTYTKQGDIKAEPGYIFNVVKKLVSSGIFSLLGEESVDKYLSILN